MRAGTDRGVRQAVAGAAAVVVAGGLLLLPVPAGALVPSSGVAQVDGSVGEWTAADDVAALVGNDPPHHEWGRLSLRYDCDEEVLYALLAAGPGVRLQAIDPDEAYLRLGDEPKLVSGTDEADGDAPDAAWVDRQGGTAAGIELSAELAPGSYDQLRVHAKLPDDSEDGYQTVDLSPRYQRLDIACDDEGAVVDVALVADPPAAAPDTADPPGLARTGAPLLPVLTGIGLLLVAGGAVLRSRRSTRPAGP